MSVRGPYRRRDGRPAAVREDMRGDGFCRLWRVVLALRRRPHTLRELALALDVSTRTVRRDLYTLRRVPLPITRQAQTRQGLAVASLWSLGDMAEWPREAPLPVADIGAEAAG